MALSNILRISNELNQNIFFDILKLVSGTIFAQGMIVLASPIITRLYGPDSFGLLAVFLSITGIPAVIICLRYEFSIMLPKSDDEAANILGLCFIIITILDIFIFIFLILLHDRLISIIGAPQMSNLLLLLPLSIYINGVYQALNYWNSRTKHFGRLSIAKISCSATILCTQFAAALTGYASGASLIYANILGYFISILTLGMQIWRDDSTIFKKSIALDRMISAFKRYNRFPKYDVTSALLNNVSWQSPILILSSFFPTTVVGYYSLGFMMLQFPMNLIGGSISQVFFQRVSEVDQRMSIGIIVRPILKFLIRLSLIPMLSLGIIGSDIFITFFGKIWSEAGVYAQIMSPWAFIWFISSPLSTLYIVSGKQEFGLKFNALNFISRFLALVIGGIADSARLSILLFSIVGLFTYSYFLVKILSFANISKGELIKMILDDLLLFVPIFLILLSSKLINTTSLVRTILFIIILIIYYSYTFKSSLALIRDH